MNITFVCNDTLVPCYSALCYSYYFGHTNTKIFTSLSPPPLFAIAISLGGENCGHGPKYEIIRSIRTFRFFFPNIRLYVLFLISERGKSQIAKNFSEI